MRRIVPSVPTLFFESLTELLSWTSAPKFHAPNRPLRPHAFAHAFSPRFSTAVAPGIHRLFQRSPSEALQVDVCWQAAQGMTTDQYLSRGHLGYPISPRRSSQELWLLQEIVLLEALTGTRPVRCFSRIRTQCLHRPCL